VKLEAFSARGLQSWTKMKTPLPGIPKPAVGGIGDDAFYALVGPYATLSVKKGNTVFIVRVYGVPGQAKQESIEKALAKDVLARV